MLKERNMLLTTEHAYKQAIENMPNQERVDKVCCCFESEGLLTFGCCLVSEGLLTFGCCFESEGVLSFSGFFMMSKFVVSYYAFSD